MERPKVCDSSYTSDFRLFLNGKETVVPHVDPEMTLLQFVRKQGWTGAKLGCGEGGCGACTLMLSKWLPKEQRVAHMSVNGCLLPLAAAEGCAVTTPEGLGNTRVGISLLQKRIATYGGSQCGFCTPGFAVALHAFLREHPHPTELEVEECLDGNLCRCTGYRPILDAAKSLISGCESYLQAVTGDSASSGCCKAAPSSSATSTAPAGCCGGAAAGGGCCKAEGGCMPKEIDNDVLSSQYIFPPALKRHKMGPMYLSSGLAQWIRPLTLGHLLQLKHEVPDAKILNGNTECGIETKIRGRRYHTLIHPVAVAELHELSTDGSAVTIGSAVTLTEIGRYCKQLKADLPTHTHQVLDVILTQLRFFAGHQVRNTAAIGGNICTASPISDLNPIWIAADAVFHVASVDGERAIPARSFFLDYRKTALQPNEVLVKITFDLSREGEYMRTYKQARRRDDDIAIVTGAMRVVLEEKDGKRVVKDMSCGYGGVNKTPVFAHKTAEAFAGVEWNAQVVDIAKASLAKDVDLPENAPGGMVKFRQTLVTSFFFKFYLSVQQQLDAAGVDAREQSATLPYSRPVSHGTQTFEVPVDDGAASAPRKHAAAIQQVTGEAMYTEDMALPPSALYGAFIKSTCAWGIVTVDWDALKAAALKLPGVVDIVSHQDVRGENQCGIAFQDEEVFVEKEVLYQGHALALVLATSHDHAAFAANQLERHAAIAYDTTGKEPIITVEQAIEKNSFFDGDRVIDTGGVEEALAACDHTLEGEVHINAQEHFYLENHVAVATPREAGEMEIFASTQNPSKTQYIAARALGVPANRVVARVKRLGGGFGGKESRSLAVSTAAAVAAAKVNVPVLIALDRNVDMLMSGTRHPFLYKYRVGFSADGRIEALDAKLYANAGFSVDLSWGVLERGVYHIQNAYNIRHIRAEGRLCRTNRASNTAFRGFGGPQAMFACESIVDRLAAFLKKPTEAIREMNLYKEGDTTHYEMTLKDCYLSRMWDGIMKSSEFEARRKAVDEFNASHKWKKRGIAVIPTMYGMSFTIKFLNQAGALVHLYTDGSVLVSHGGTEMGQGLHTKMAQVAARALGVAVSDVHILETATDKVSNTSPTAASVSSDLNGLAIMDACKQLNERLAPFKEKYPEKSWKELISAAYFERVNLSANGFYCTPNVNSYFETRGKPFNYFCYGTACAEVEIDCLTGDYWVPRADILMDVGKSLNPSIDLGQIEGAFVQGMGLFTLEEVVYFRNGALFTRGPGSYKIPTANDIPVDFRVELLSGAENHRPAPFSSKGVGEPPLFLSSSVFFAIKNAIRAARLEHGVEEDFRLDSPATCERIRNACADSFVEQFKDKKTAW